MKEARGECSIITVNTNSPNFLENQEKKNRLQPRSKNYFDIWNRRMIVATTVTLGSTDMDTT